MSRLIDCDSEETTTFKVCEICDGAGGWDISRDCEVYDEWKECPNCLGTGEIENEDH